MSLDYRFRVSLLATGSLATALPGFLDMLRYDGAEVLAWDHVSPSSPGAGPEYFVVTLRTVRPPTVERWRSFSLFPKDAVSGVPLASNGLPPATH